MNVLFIDTPSHGYLKVPASKAFPIADKISRYSYLSRDRKFAFLGEDCDAPVFLKEYPDCVVTETHSDYFDTESKHPFSSRKVYAETSTGGGND